MFVLNDSRLEKHIGT